MDSLEDIQMYTKFVGETSAYSEISESNRNGQVPNVLYKNQKVVYA